MPEQLYVSYCPKWSGVVGSGHLLFFNTQLYLKMAESELLKAR